MLRRLVGLAALALSILGFVFRETIASLIAKFAEKVFHPAIFDGGHFVTFTIADIMLLVLFGVATVALFWPWLARLLQTEVERNSLTVPTTARRVFVGLNFHNEKSARFLSKVFKPVFVDCTLRVNRIAVPDCIFGDSIRLETTSVTFCSNAELEAISKNVFTISRANFLNSPIYCSHIFMVPEMGREIFGAAAPKGLLPLDPALLVPPMPVAAYPFQWLLGIAGRMRP